MITRTFKLCLNAGTGSAPYINVSQYDEGETWLFELYSETGERYIPTTGAIVGVKSDGHGIANTGTVDSEGRVVITETQQMTASAGRAIFELSIDGLTHGTANFVVAVERKPTDDAVMSDSDLSLIQEAVDAAETIEDLIEGHDPDEVIADAVDAWLDAHPEATTTVEDGAITSAKLNDEVKTGVFEDMTVGTSLAVMNDEGQTDNLAYKFRQTGADAVRELDEIVGGTIAWNQMVNTGATSVTVQSGHKYLSKVNGVQTIGASTGSAISINDASADNVFDLTQMFGSTVADAIYAMEQSSAGSGVAYFRSLFPNSYYAYNAGELVSVEGLSSHETTGANMFDPAPLLEAQGWAVDNGDYYGSNALLYNKYAHGLGGYPAHGIFKENTQYTWEFDFYSRVAYATIFRFYYTDGTMTETSSASTTPTRVSITSTAGKTVQHIAFSYSNTSTIHLSNIMLTEGTDGTYKPYQKHTYPLDSTLTLRGVPKWSNGLYFDGDIYRHDGSVQKRYGVVDLGTLNWNYVEGSNFNFRCATDIGALAPATSQSKVNAVSSIYLVLPYTDVANTDKSLTIVFETSTAAGKVWVHDSSYSDAATFKSAMSGAYLVYELETPTAETADPYQQYQICDGKGTEEYVSETVTPVGHNTFYPVDIVAKVNKLPSDFSTLIAPTEEGFKATRNYTVNDLLIVNNVLYKVTANIANGGTITVNTNVQQTTLGALIKALS